MSYPITRRYPVGIQTFSEIREQGYVYVDKTEYVWRLAHESGKAFFLSRPRRFGKSLLLSTMEAYFEGRRELFEGLALEGLEQDWESYPVIRLDMSVMKCDTKDELMAQLDSLLRRLEARYGSRGDEMPGDRLAALIEAAHAQTGRQAVVLVDEYDAPLLNVVDDPDKLEEFRQVMRGFYIPLKAMDAHLRFVFLTGITKYSQLSIFSELNNLSNISMDPAYAAICGITEEELRSQMAPDVALLAEKMGISVDEAYNRLKEHYDGYRFCNPSPNIYNPFSLISAFRMGDIGSFWFGSGTPTSLIRLIKANGWALIDLDGCEAEEDEFDAPAEDLESPLAFLYQAGYLTIKRYDREGHAYVLGIPNVEVRRGLSQSLLRYTSPQALREHRSFLRSFAKSLRSGDIEGALAALRSYLAGIPYHLSSKSEKDFETMFYLIFDLLGIQIETEYQTSTGRADAVVRTKDSVYVFEFKYDRSAREALEQIDAKDYTLPFEADGRRVVKVGANYSPEKRTIDDWIVG